MWLGVRVLAWPQHGDQKINASLVERIGLGIWESSWGWGGKDIVKGQQIAEKVSELMGNELLRMKAVSVREKARAGMELGGTSEKMKALAKLIETWQKDRS
ncbi:hypothetical protein Dsin_022855 [Dipteronia sinensis]|uniref:Uncharacterized protein n=1 Tax=Dipteronia sinensis TaxID=43782 RepID=A0AAE0A2B9_9ROSI|nr:hypothetical protein Dsin_022855 [Dipteronia sinensis]